MRGPWRGEGAIQDVIQAASVLVPFELRIRSRLPQVVCYLGRMERLSRRMWVLLGCLRNDSESWLLVRLRRLHTPDHS